MTFDDDDENEALQHALGIRPGRAQRLRKADLRLWLYEGLDRLDDTIVIADVAGRVVFANRSACRRAGVDDPTGMSLAEFTRLLGPETAPSPTTESPVAGLDVLSPREREVTAAFLRGYGTQTISDRLNVSASTVRNHLKNACRKLGVRSQVELRELFARGR